MSAPSAAILREKDAEIEYLRARNLLLSEVIDNLAQQIAELQEELEAWRRSDEMGMEIEGESQPSE